MAVAAALASLLVASLVTVAVPQEAPSRSTQTKVVRIAKADSFTTAARPRKNFGGRKVLKVKRKPRARTFLRFETSGLGIVQSATLRVYARTAGGRPVVAKAVNGGWREKKITHRNAPGLGDRIGRHPRHGAKQWLNIDVTEAVSTAGRRFDVALLTRAGRAIKFASREAGKKPRLRIVVEPPQPVRVAASADIACDPDDPNYNDRKGTSTHCRHEYTSDLVFGTGYEAVLLPGDLQYEEGDADDFDVSYAPTWGRVSDISHPVPGNHEYRTPGAAGYFEHFGKRAGDPSKGYYDFTLGAWHVLALNSQCGREADCDQTAQVNWLKRRLSARNASCILAFWHHPRFSSRFASSKGRTRDFWDALYRHGADLVIAGHEHFYERFEPQNTAGDEDPAGPVQFIVGTGGKSLFSPFDEIHPNSVARNNHTYGILDLTLRHDGYDFEFVPEEGKVYTDSGSGTC